MGTGSLPPATLRAFGTERRGPTGGPTTSTSELTHALAMNPPALILSGRFVDRDMFMRYRGGGIGHKYMREIEAKYENMSIERDHWNSHPKPTRANNTGERPSRSNNNEGEGLGREPPRGSQAADRDESDDTNYVPSESGDSSDDYSAGSDDDSNDGESDGEEDPGEIGSDAGYDSYGLADL